jgi:hypothetical protein
LAWVCTHPPPRMPLRYYRIFSTFLLQRKETVLLQAAVTYQFLSAVNDLESPYLVQALLSLGSLHLGYSYTRIEARTKLRFTVFRGERGRFSDSETRLIPRNLLIPLSVRNVEGVETRTLVRRWYTVCWFSSMAWRLRLESKLARFRAVGHGSGRWRHDPDCTIPLTRGRDSDCGSSKR